MFDIGFSEMMVCAIVALVVIGPEKLPRVARTLGHLFGRLQRYVSQVKSDIHREMEMADLGKVKTEFENAARSFQTDIETAARETEREARDIADAAAAIPQEPPVEPPSASPQLELGIEAPAADTSARKQASG